jgi:acetyl esterase/lipase
MVEAQDLVPYKQVDTTRLFMEVIRAQAPASDSPAPALVFFFGGGWVNGDRTHFARHADYFARRGLTCFLVDYRIRSKHGTSPFESLEDARSAMRYVRAHAGDFDIDPDRIVASGGSAGGHLAAATALTSAYNASSDDTTVSCLPNALVLFNPVIDNGPGGYGFDRIGEAYPDFSPLHNIRKGAPPTIVFLGTEDPLIPVETGEYFAKVMERVGSRCDLHLYEGQKHGFFNYTNFVYYRRTVVEADVFLQSLGYLKPLPAVKIR